MVYSKDRADTTKDSVEQKDEKAPEFVIQRLYIKDLSIETPNSPHIFLEPWEPELSMDLQTKTNALGDNAHEVVLTITVTVKIKDKTAFLVEAKQAGVFTIANFSADQLQPMLGSFCPNILYPYVREVVTDAVVKAGFPQLYLMPVNFDALYEQHRQEEKK